METGRFFLISTSRTFKDRENVLLVCSCSRDISKHIYLLLLHYFDRFFLQPVLLVRYSYSSKSLPFLFFLRKIILVLFMISSSIQNSCWIGTCKVYIFICFQLLSPIKWTCCPFLLDGKSKSSCRDSQEHMGRCCLRSGELVQLEFLISTQPWVHCRGSFNSYSVSYMLVLKCP